MKKTKKSVILILVASFCFFNLSYGQNAELNSDSYRRLTTLDWGVGYAQIQDKATSPLIYSGAVFGVGVGQSFRKHDQYDMYWKLDLGVGSLENSPSQKTLSTTNSATLIKAQAHFGVLTDIDFLKSDNLAFKVGGKVDYWQGIRINTNHQNNAAGSDGVLTLSASAHGQYAWNKVRNNGGNVSRRLYLTTHVGLLNLNNRPGYNYNTSMPLISSEHSTDKTVAREWAMNGFKWQTELAWQTQRVAGYATQFSYEFTGLKAPGKYEPMGMTEHRLKYTIFLIRK